MAAAIEYGSVGTATATSSVATITGLDFNAEASDRIIAATIAWESGATITAVTIGGVSATKRAEAVSTNRRVHIWAAEVPTGTSGDVAATFNFDFAIVTSVDTHSITGADPTPTDSDTATSTSAATLSITALTIDTDGVGLVGYINDVDTVAVSWTGATVSQDTDAGICRHSSARVTAAGTNTITADGFSANQALVGVAWGPAAGGGATTSLPPTAAPSLPPATFVARQWQAHQYVVQSFIFTAAYVPPPPVSLLWRSPSVSFAAQAWLPPAPVQPAFIGSNGGPPLVTPSLIYRPTFFDHMIIR